MCVHSVQFIFLCLIYPRFSDEAYFFSIRLIFVIFNVKYFCIEAKIEIKFASPLTVWSEKKPPVQFLLLLFLKTWFFMISRGKITLFTFLESKKICPTCLVSSKNRDQGGEANVFYLWPDSRKYNYFCIDYRNICTQLYFTVNSYRTFQYIKRNTIPLLLYMYMAQ